MTLSAATTVVTCAGTRHTLVWRDGSLEAFDHPEPERERALTALGGETYRCLQLLERWEQHADDLDVLVLASRGPADRLLAPPDDRHTRHGHHRHSGHYSYSSFAGSGSYAPLTSMTSSSPGVRLQDVLRLGGRLPDRLVVQVITGWTGRIERGDEAVVAARPRLHAALYGRVAAILREWLGDPALGVDLEMSDSGSRRVIERDGSGLRVRLPFAWLAEVWAPGLAVVADRLVLSAVHRDVGQVELSTLDRGLTHRATVTIDVAESG